MKRLMIIVLIFLASCTEVKKKPVPPIVIIDSNGCTYIGEFVEKRKWNIKATDRPCAVEEIELH